MHIVRRTAQQTAGLEGCVSHGLIRAILAARGVHEPQDVELRLRDLLHYRTLMGIEPAADLLAAAIVGGTCIGIAGDYDVDGMSGTALGVLALRELGAREPVWFVPSRYAGGYGLSGESVDYFKAQGAGLIVTVDNGISSAQAVERAREYGIPVIITDHHSCPDKLPAAAAIVNPRQPGCAFPSKNLAGVGVLFYLLLAVRRKLADQGFFSGAEPQLAHYLDLVALGTVADLVELDPNNRRLVAAALERMRRGEMQVGLRAIMQVAGSSLSDVSAQTLAFDIAPRLNAAMRLKLERNYAMECLLAQEAEAAADLARRLDFCNRRRSDHQRVMCQEALRLLGEEDDGQSAIVLASESFLNGISGLVAAELCERLGRPCFIFAPAGEVMAGSGRSAGSVDLAQILAELAACNPGLLLRHGGHAQAAGVTVRRGQVAEFAALFKERAAARINQDQAETVYSDGELPAECCCLDFALQLLRYGPYGKGFEEPCFDGIFEVETVHVVAGRHLSLKLRRTQHAMYAMLFRAAPQHLQLRPGNVVQALYCLGVGHYHHHRRFEVRIRRLEQLS